jgi:hypothetical protein
VENLLWVDVKSLKNPHEGDREGTDIIIGGTFCAM